MSLIENASPAMILGIVGAAAFAIGMFLWYGLLSPDPLDLRIKGLIARRDALRAGVASAPKRGREPFNFYDFMHRVVERLHLLRSQHAEGMADRLAHAGWRSKEALVTFLFFKTCLPLVFGGAAVIPLYVLKLYSLPEMVPLLISVAAVFVGAYAPDLFVRNAAGKRRDKIRKSLPDGLDLMVVCAEAGLSLDATLKRVAEEIKISSTELADELEVTGLELRFLQERHQALENLSRRTNLADVRGVVTTLIQTEKFGTPLAQSLRVLASEFRDERLLRAEEKAARLPATLTVPLILFILPALVVVLIGPAIINAIDVFMQIR